MEKSTLIGMGILVVIVAVGLFFVNGGSPTSNVIAVDGSGTGLSGQVTGGMRHVPIVANRFDFSPGIIRVKQGETVMIMIDNQDTTHGINIPAFNAAGKNMVTFKADKKGTFDFYCATMCGVGHKDMVGKLIVE